MERTIELFRSNDKQHSLIKWEGKVTKYIVCSFYHSENPIGKQWDHGHYFDTIEEAFMYMFINDYTKSRYEVDDNEMKGK